MLPCGCGAPTVQYRAGCSGGPASYLAGRRYADEWYAGPFGPAFGQEADARWQWASRTSDRIDVELPLYGDRAGHAG